MEPDTVDPRGPAMPPARSAYRLALVGLLAVVVAAALAAYARVAPGDGRLIITLGFSRMLPLKTWLTAGAALLGLVQALSAARMWGRLPATQGPAPAWVTPLHRWSAPRPFVLTRRSASTASGLSISPTTRPAPSCTRWPAASSTALLAARMLALRVRGLPGWTVPLLGGALVRLIAVLWFGAALWYLTRTGVPLT